ncbi:MAG TPA: hypothetical protein VHH55_04990 [Gaiellaceae bacterium]|nr:hypothetical protein [Gaiellaceae bacterium]
MAKRKRKKGTSEPLLRGEDLPSVRLLRELAAKSWADLEARRLAHQREAREAADG